jgi:hypothetical protein
MRLNQQSLPRQKLSSPPAHRRRLCIVRSNDGIIYARNQLRIPIHPCMYRDMVCNHPHAITTCFALARAWLRHAQNTVHLHDALPELLPSLRHAHRPAIPAFTAFVHGKLPAAAPPPIG